MKAIRAALLLNAAIVMVAQSQTANNVEAQARSSDNVNSPARPWAVGTSLPSACATEGQAFFLSNAPAGRWLYVCAQSGKGLSWVPAWNAGGGEGDSEFAVTFTAKSISVGAGHWGVGTTTFYEAGVTANVVSLPVSAATTGKPITLTVPNVIGTHSGDTSMVSGAKGNSAANGTWTILVENKTQISLASSAGSGAYGGGGVLGGTGNGTIYIWANRSGSISFLTSASTGLILPCTGSCVSNQSVDPHFDPIAYPIAIADVAGGEITAIHDVRTSHRVLGVETGGNGITVTPIGGIFQIWADPTLADVSGNNSFSGNNIFGGGVTLQPAASQPACDAAHRGTVWNVQGTADDKLEVCQMVKGALKWVTH